MLSLNNTGIGPELELMLSALGDKVISDAMGVALLSEESEFMLIILNRALSTLISDILKATFRCCVIDAIFTRTTMMGMIGEKLL